MSTLTIPALRTERLVLRAPRMSDFEVYEAFFASDRSAIVGGPLSRDRAWDAYAQGCGQWLLRGYGQWIGADPDTDRPLVRLGIYHPLNWPEPELAWIVLDPAAEGRGLAREGALAARAAATRLWDIRRPISSIAPTNARSEALAVRLGAVFEREWDSPFGPMRVWRHPEEAT